MATTDFEEKEVVQVLDKILLQMRITIIMNYFERVKLRMLDKDVLMNANGSSTLSVSKANFRALVEYVLLCFSKRK